MSRDSATSGPFRKRSAPPLPGMLRDAKEPFGYRMVEGSAVAVPVSLVASQIMTIGTNV